MAIGTSRLQESSAEGNAMTATGAFVGLCLTCNNSGTCVYRKRRGTDAIYCETFDAYVAPQNGHSSKAVEATLVRPLQGDKAAATGLCVNCAHIDSCRLSKPEGGVWHCEEYE